MSPQNTLQDLLIVLNGADVDGYGSVGLEIESSEFGIEYNEETNNSMGKVTSLVASDGKLFLTVVPDGTAIKISHAIKILKSYASQGCRDFKIYVSTMDGKKPKHYHVHRAIDNTPRTALIPNHQHEIRVIFEDSALFL